MSEANGGDVRVFRGRSLEEVLPQIRAELGPDAIITRQREGLQGGIAGFFGALRRAGARRLAVRATFFRAGACRFRDAAPFLPFAGALDFLLAVFRLAIFRFFAIAMLLFSSDPSLPMKLF